MATYTAVAGGGNWNSAATWGGAGFPIAGDTAILNATSGQVTVTANATCLILNCTGYANTLTINNGITLTVNGVGATISLGGTIASGTTGVLSTVGTNTAVTINFNGITIPRLTVGYNNGVTTPVQTMTINGTNPTVQNFTFGSIGRVVLSGTELTITSSFTSNATGVPHLLSGTTLRFSGTVSYQANAGQRLAINMTVTTGSTLILNSNFLTESSVITFQTGSFLTHNNFTLTPRGTITLDTSPIEWYDITLVVDQTTLNLTSDLNITNKVEVNASVFGTIFRIQSSGGTRNVNIKGSLISIASTVTADGLISNSTTNFNLIGTGTLRGRFNNVLININTTNPLGYTIGDNTLNNLLLFTNSVLTLVGTSVAQVFNSSSLLRIGGNPVTLDTNRTSTGGSQIFWANVDQFIVTSVLVLNTETTFRGNATFNNTFTLNGSKCLIEGSFSAPNSSIGGTSIIELAGSNNSNWNSGTTTTATYQNNITVNKSGGATVSILNSLTWGLAGRTLQRTAGNINPGTSTVTIPNAAVTINNMVFNNLTITAGPTITQNSGNTVNGNLTCNGTTTFSGTAGFTTGGFICTTAASTLTLQSGVTYSVTSNLDLFATLASPIILTSSSAAANTKLTLSNNATQRVYFVRATRIDSGDGQTIWNSYSTLSTPLTNTINWNPGVKPAPYNLIFIS
jgi:hypothetical protein